MTKNDRFIVVDTETTNSIDDPLCYDVGFAVVDMFGNVYENYSFVVADIFLDKELMSYAYFADKKIGVNLCPENRLGVLMCAEHRG